MARPPLTEEERDCIVRTFITSAFTVMEDCGPQAVTVRKVAELSDYKPSTLYNYFEDAEHLAMCASMRYLSDYSRNLAEHAAEMDDPLERFYSVWDYFNDAALQHPEAFHRLFFGKHRAALPKVIDTYYHVFPEELEGIDPVAMQMMQIGSIEDRNFHIMAPLIECGIVDAETAPAINTIITALLRVMLEEKIDAGSELDNDFLKARHHRQMQLLLDVSAA